MINPNIPLAGVQPDLVNVLARSTQAAGLANQTQQQNQLAAFNAKNGAGVMAGDPNALAGYAGIAGPEAAMNIQSTQQAMQMRQAQEARLARDQSMQTENHKIAISEYVASLDAREAAAEAAKIEAGIKSAFAAFQAGDLNGVNAILAQAGEQPLSDLAQFPAVVSKYGDALDALKKVSEFGKVKPEDEYQRYVQEEVQAGRQPLDRIGFAQAKAKPANSVTLNNYNAPEDGAVFKKLDEAQGNMFADLLAGGMNVPQKLAQVDRLEELLLAENTPEGMAAAIKLAAGEYGIDSEGLSDLQAAQAIINQLVPQQRQPGSGPMSDADLALFKQSLPRMINTKDGNAMIINTVRGLAVYQLRQSEIAAKLANREISATEARKELMALKNPLEVFRRSGPTAVGGGYTIEEVK